MRPSLTCFPSESSPGSTEDLIFRPSKEMSVGVELELQILDPTSRELAPGAVRILDACAEEKLPGISGEFLLCMIEAKTEVCRDTTEVQETLLPALSKLTSIARSLGYELVSGATHPYGRPLMTAVYPDDRYKRICSKQGWHAYQEAIFGLHVHVGVSSADEAIQISNYLSTYLPHLLALSANSPLWEGLDTGFASARARMFRPSPHIGAPPQFRNWNDLTRFVEFLRQRGVIEGLKDLYWDIRPRPDYGTLEFRIFDAPPTTDHLLALVALTRCLVAFAKKRLLDRPKLGAASYRRAWIANERRWLASRYGLEAVGRVRQTGEPRSIGQESRELVRCVLPIADALGERHLLEPLLMLPNLTTGADRQRQAFRDHGRWQAVVDDMLHRWGASLGPNRTSRSMAPSTSTARNGAAQRDLLPNHDPRSRLELARTTAHY